jgi:hypothetical protein
LRSSGRAVSGLRLALSFLGCRAVGWRVPGAPLNAGVRAQTQMRSRWKRIFWIVALFQAAVVFGTLGVWYYGRTVANLANPSDGDLYAHSWSFQIMVFLVVYLPTTSILFAALLALEFLIVSWFTEPRGRNPFNRV